MSAQQQAEELVNEFIELGKDFTRGVSMREFAVQCALITVNKILKANPTSEVSAPFLGTRVYNDISYWELVKKEILKLC